MQIQSSSTSFSASHTGSMASAMPFATYGGLASGGHGFAQTGAASAYMQGRQDAAASTLHNAAYMQGRQDGAVDAALSGGGPRIYSPESVEDGAANASGNAERAGDAGGNCPDGKCSPGGSGDIGQTLMQVLQALGPMMQMIAPIAGMMGGGGMPGGLGGGKSA